MMAEVVSGKRSPRVLIVVNDVAAIKPESTTADLIRRAQRAGWTVHTVGVTDLLLGRDGRAVARSTSADSGRRGPRLVERFDAVLIRTNPARDTLGNFYAHRFALRVLTELSDAGIPVFNAPRGLMRADSKAFLYEVPEACRPPMIVAQHPTPVLRFVDELDGDAVVKPAHGTHGVGVVRLRPKEVGRRQVVESILTYGPVVVQPFLPEAVHGDTRVIVVGGRVLDVDGVPCAVRRIPAEGDFRSNIAAGGKAAPGELTDGMRVSLEMVGPVLLQHGLWMVGLDFIGDQIIEINAYSPGGLADASRFAAVDFGAEILERLHRAIVAVGIAAQEHEDPA